MDYSKKNIIQLKILCKTKGIKGYTGKRKEDLMQMLSAHDAAIEPVKPAVSVPAAKAAELVDAIIAAIEPASEVTAEAAAAKAVELVDAVIVAAEPLKPIKPVSSSILSASHWKNTKAFKAIKDKETQLKYYARKESCEEVMQLVALESKPFGSESEKIIAEIFGLGPRTSSQNDGTRNGKKIEIKSARYWAGKDDCVWQHLEPEHDYEFALFALLDFQGWKIWGISKSLLMGEMRDKKIVTFQGKQGWWVKKSAILPHLTELHSVEELDTLLSLS